MTAMASLLLREPPLVVLPSLADAIGLHQAILLQQIHFRSLDSADGWVVRTRKAWRREVRFLSEDQIKRALVDLRRRDLIDAEYVETATGREPRYRVRYEQVDALEGVGANSPDGSGTSAPTHRGRSARRRSFKRGERTAGERDVANAPSLPEPASQSPAGEVASLTEQQLARSIVLVLARRMAELRLDHNPRAKVAPTSRRWLEPIRLLIDRDGYSPSEVRAMIEFSQAHSRERIYTQSPDALRKNADKIVEMMRADGVAPFGGAGRSQARPSAGDLVDAMTRGAAA